MQQPSIRPFVDAGSGPGPELAVASGAGTMTPSAHAPGTLPAICDNLRHRVLHFLEEKTDDEVLRSVQSQTRISMRVIDEALQRYGYAEHLEPTRPDC